MRQLTQVKLKAPYLILIGDTPNISYAKTALGIVHWRRNLVAGQLRLAGGNVDLGVPDMSPASPSIVLLGEKPDIFMSMGDTAEVVAQRYNVTREMQDEYSVQSQERYANAVDSGYFADEIVPMNTTMKKVNKETGEETLVDVVVDRDDCNRPGTTMEGLAGLKPVFAEDGSVTAGNSSQLSDGASMTLLMSADRAEQLGQRTGESGGASR